MSGQGGKGGGAIEEAFRFITEIAIIEQLARAALEKVMPADMTQPQFDVLHHLARLGGEWTPLRIANAMQVAISSTRVLSRSGPTTVTAAPSWCR
jgi:hypothetical protein